MFSQHLAKATGHVDQLLASCVENALDQMADGRGPELFDQYQRALDHADAFSKAMITLGFSRMLEAIRDRACETE